MSFSMSGCQAGMGDLSDLAIEGDLLASTPDSDLYLPILANFCQYR